MIPPDPGIDALNEKLDEAMAEDAGGDEIPFNEGQSQGR